MKGFHQHTHPEILFWRICLWLLELKGKKCSYDCVYDLHQLFLTEQIIEDINLIIFYNASYLINNKVGR